MAATERTTIGMIERLRALDVFPLLVGALLVAKVFWTRHLVIGAASGTGFIADVVFLVALWALSSAIPGRLGRAALAVSALGVSIALLGVALYSSYFEQLPSPGMLMMASQLRVGSDVLGLMSLRTILLVIDLPIVFWAALRPPRGRRMAWRPAVSLGLVSMVIAIALTVFTAVTGTEDGMAASYRLGLLSFQSAAALDLSGARAGESIALENVQARIDGLTGHVEGPRVPGAPAFGQFSGASVVVIQMEALQAGLVGARIDGRPVVPNLESLISRSHYFPNTYSQIGRGNTADAEFVANTSLLPPRNEPASVAYARKELPGLPRLLAQRGYSTATFHTNDAQFWNRFQLYPALGFDVFCDRSWFGDEDITGYGPSDRVLYQKTLPLLASEAVQGNPFYASLVTISAHHPFRSTEKRSPLQLPADIAGTTTGRYLKAQAYSDAQLGWFIDQLEQHHVLDECILVIYGDHFGMRWEDETDKDVAIRKSLLGHSYNRADFYNVPLIVRLPGQQQPVVSDVVLGQVDIMPTVADLLGVDLSDVPHFGRSAFVQTPTVLARPGALAVSIDDTLLYIKGINDAKDRFYDSDTQQKLAITQPPPEAFANAMKQLQLSEEYASSLPERAGATSQVGYIPKSGLDFR